MKFTKALFAVTLLVTLGFTSCKPKDADLKSAIETKIAATPELTGVTVEVKGRVATLNGEVKDASAKAMATAIGKEIKGLKSVVDNTTIAAPVVETAPVVNPADDILTKGLTDALKDFPSLTSSVNNGIVTLSGEIAKSKWITVKQSIDKLKPAGYDLKALVVK